MGANVERCVAEIEDQGYSVLEGAIEPELVVELRDTIRSLQKELGTVPRGNPAEGVASLRIYNLLAKHPVFQRMAIHPATLPVAERVLDEECLLSGMTAIDIGPGERFQGMHSDEVVMTIPRPRIPLMCVAMWALTDFTADNGGTRLVPGSHREPTEPQQSDLKHAIAMEAPAGSVIFFHGGLWHCGGANVTDDEWRLGVNVQYCHGYIRQQQNPYLGIPPEVVGTFPERLLKLTGFHLYRGIMGHIDGDAPGQRVLGQERFAERAYDETRVVGFERQS